MATKETRAARHNGRGGKKGAYSAKHNDRNFDVTTVNHIDPTLAHLNIHQRFAGEYEGARTNEEYELAFYEDHFGESLARKNAAYKAKGKAGQIKTMEEYHRSMKSCPEETYYTAGEGVDRELLWEIYSKHQAWKAEQFPQCRTLTADLHADEPNAMLHIHERSVWIGHDSKGMEVVGQAKALAEMGVERPDPTKKTGKHNNAKQTFTRECRENFVQICREHGLEIVMEAKPSGEVGLDLTEYKIQHALQREQEAQEQLQETQEHLRQREAENARLQEEIKGAEAQLALLISEISEQEQAYQQQQEVYAQFMQRKETLQLDALNDSIAQLEGIAREISEVPKSITGKRKVEPSFFDQMMEVIKNLWKLVSNLVLRVNDLSDEVSRLERFEGDYYDMKHKAEVNFTGYAKAKQDLQRAQRISGEVQKERDQLRGMLNGLQEESQAVQERLTEFLKQAQMPDGRNALDAFNAAEDARLAADERRERPIRTQPSRRDPDLEL